MSCSNRDWAWSGRDQMNAFMRDLDLFGEALESTDNRDGFWEPYQRLALAADALKQATLCATNAPSAETTSQFGQHLAEAASHLRLPSEDFPPKDFANRSSPNSHAAQWDTVFKALLEQFENIRLVHIAHPTGGMDQ